KLGRGRKNRCRFCTKEGCPRPAFVDYKDVPTLKKLCTSQGKLFSRKRSGNCAAFQRAVKDAIKRARFMALLPYVGECPPVGEPGVSPWVFLGGSAGLAPAGLLGQNGTSGSVPSTNGRAPCKPNSCGNWPGSTPSVRSGSI